MALQVTKPSSGGVYQGLLGSSGLDSIRYGMNEIDLVIQQENALSGGELLSPELYDLAIGKLNILKAGTKDKGLIQDIDEKVARYGITKNNLIKRITKAAAADASGSVDTISTILYNDETEYNNEKRHIFKDEYQDIGSFINTSMERELEWATRLAEENEDYKARKNKYSVDLARRAEMHLSEAGFYRGLQLMDDKKRSQYKVLVKTDAHGNVEDYVIADIRGKLPDGYKSEGFLKVNGWQMNGMDVMLQTFDEDEEGNARTYFNGVPLIEGEDGFDALEGVDAMSAFSQSRPATNLNPNAGDFITTPDDKSFIFGGFNGKSNQWHEISDQAVTTQANWWEQYSNRNKHITFDEFQNEVIDGVGEPLTIEKMKADGKTDLDNRLSAIQTEASRLSEQFPLEFLGEGLKEKLGPEAYARLIDKGAGLIPKAAGGVEPFFTEGFDPKNWRKFGRTVKRGTVESGPGQAVGQVGKFFGKVGRTTKEIFKGLFNSPPQ